MPALPSALLAATLVACTRADSDPPPPWGRHGHEIAARAAATELPAALPTFFRESAAQLEYLNPEPDRWRERAYEAMDAAWEFDHYIDLENVPAGALDAPDRWAYLRRLYAVGLDEPERSGGFLPYRILELYQRIVTEWRMWRSAGERERGWIEERIVNDAGVLGHYVTDASQPHHTTIHFNGWSAGAPNPEGYSTERDLHFRFETRFVEASVAFPDLLQRMPDGVRELQDVRAAIWDYVSSSNGQVETLYRLERDVGFDPDDPDPRSRDFAIDRLVAGAEMLRALWWAAWIESASPIEGE